MFNSNNSQDVYIEQSFSGITVTAGTVNLKEFDNCTFNGCNFTDTAFVKCKFYECRFINCNLSMVTVKNCSFFDTIFESSKVIGINWTEAAWPRIKLASPLKFYKCSLNHS